MHLSKIAFPSYISIIEESHNEVNQMSQYSSSGPHGCDRNEQYISLLTDIISFFFVFYANCCGVYLVENTIFCSNRKFEMCDTEVLSVVVIRSFSSQTQNFFLFFHQWIVVFNIHGDYYKCFLIESFFWQFGNNRRAWERGRERERERERWHLWFYFG